MKTLHLMMKDSETAAMRHPERHAQARGQSGGKARPGRGCPGRLPRGAGAAENWEPRRQRRGTEPGTLLLTVSRRKRTMDRTGSRVIESPGRSPGQMTQKTHDGAERAGCEEIGK